MGKTTQRAKARAKKAKQPEAAVPETTQVVPGEVPSLVLQRVFDHLPVFYEALKTLHEDMEEIKTLLKE